MFPLPTETLLSWVDQLTDEQFFHNPLRTSSKIPLIPKIHIPHLVTLELVNSSQCPFLGIHTNTLFRDNMPQILYLCHSEATLLLPNRCILICHRKYEHKFSQIRAKCIIHSGMKSGWSIRESQSHDEELIMPVMGTEAVLELWWYSEHKSILENTQTPFNLSNSSSIMGMEYLSGTVISFNAL